MSLWTWIRERLPGTKRSGRRLGGLDAPADTGRPHGGAFVGRYTGDDVGYAEVTGAELRAEEQAARGGESGPERSGAAPARSEREIAEELRAVREQRMAMFPTQSEPLAPDSPQPADLAHGAPGGEIAELLEREANLVLEQAVARRRAGLPLDREAADEEAAARRLLERLAR